MPRADRSVVSILSRSLLAALILAPGAIGPTSALAAPGDRDSAASRDPGAAPSTARARGRATVRIVDPVRLHLAGDRMVLDQSRHYSTSREKDGATIVHLQ